MGEGLGERVRAKTVALETALSPVPSPASGRGEHGDQDDFLTRKYHSHNSRTCFAVYPLSTIRCTNS